MLTDDKASPRSNNEDPRSPIPPYLSFYVYIEPLDPDFREQPPRHAKPDENYWLPPNKQKAYKPVGGKTFFRWMGGKIVPSGNVEPTKLSEFKAATVFTQYGDTSNLLAVPFDARKQSVSKSNHVWRNISFNHKKVGQTNNYFSSISLCGSDARLCAPAPPHWIPELLDPVYNPPPNDRVHVGMIGNLSLLFAIAAFSAPRTQSLRDVLQGCLQPGIWQAHGRPIDSSHRRRFSRCSRSGLLIVYRHTFSWHGRYHLS